jgi:xanthine dehydrogenase YagR molybdenum-binding subunit
MSMSDYAWPVAGQRTLIGKPIPRTDSPAKVCGQAKYTYDVHRPGMLYGKLVRCPYAHAKIISIDVSAAEKMPGVEAIHIVQESGSTIFWAGDDVVAIAAVDEPTAEDAARLVKVEYQMLPHLVSDAEPPASAIGPAVGPMGQDDIWDLTDVISDEQVAAEVQKRGVRFRPTQAVLAQLKKFMMPDVIVEAVGKAPYSPLADENLGSFYQKGYSQSQGDPAKAFSEAEVISEGLYGCSVITHCCLESHGSVMEWPDKDHLLSHMSTQGVSAIGAQLADPLNISAANIRVVQDHIGGGFGSKFAVDRWHVAAAQLSRKAGGRPVRIMLEREAELEVAGARPSAYARVRIAAKKDGTLTGWESRSWSTGGPGGGGLPPVPLVFEIPNQLREHTAIRNNIGPGRAWRAPGFSQAAVITMCALNDLAGKLGMNPVDLWLKNLDMMGSRKEIYREELLIAAELMEWKKKWQPRGQNKSGSLARGLGLSMHLWGGRGHACDCDLTVHPDGSVDIKMGSQDLGTGTRTVISVVAAETFALPVNAINLQIGDSQFPASGVSGGSSSVGGVSASTRRAAIDARDVLFSKVAPALNVSPDQLECVEGTVRVKKDLSKSLSWKEACSKLGAIPITIRGRNPDSGKLPDLSGSGVGGVQMAEVEVDTDTGIVRVKKMVAVQDCGLVINPKTAESQCLGALIMGISYALFEEKIMDSTTGRMVNPNMQFYRLAGFADIPELVVHLMTGKGYDERGVIGLGEPPVISPGAAISTAVANAIGVTVPFLPLTPDRVLDALARKAGA